MTNSFTISAAVEGIVDEAVARTLIFFVGGSPGRMHGKQGKPFLQQRIVGYNAAAQHAPWMVLVTSITTMFAPRRFALAGCLD